MTSWIGFEPGTLEACLRQARSGVLYRDEPTAIVVVAVYHSKRHPRGWILRR